MKSVCEVETPFIIMIKIENLSNCYDILFMFQEKVKKNEVESTEKAEVNEMDISGSKRSMQSRILAYSRL